MSTQPVGPNSAQQQAQQEMQQEVDQAYFQTILAQEPNLRSDAGNVASLVSQHNAITASLNKLGAEALIDPNVARAIPALIKQQQALAAQITQAKNKAERDLKADEAQLSRLSPQQLANLAAKLPIENAELRALLSVAPTDNPDTVRR
jgi:hypothetical protein